MEGLLHQTKHKLRSLKNLVFKCKARFVRLFHKPETIIEINVHLFDASMEDKVLLSW